jgi:phosphodiesterase/alkaline phosphatase D-like protein
VQWRVATDEQMRRVVSRGVALAPAELAHSVHVEVDGLQPRRDYFYQFSTRNEENAVGHFRTAPAEHQLVPDLQFAFVTCQDWPSGFYTAYRDMVRYDLDTPYGPYYSPMIPFNPHIKYYEPIGDATSRRGSRRRKCSSTCDL